MRYLVFMPQDEVALGNVYRSLSNIAPELDDNVGVLIWTDKEDLYLSARNDGEEYLDGAEYSDYRVIFSEADKKVDTIKDSINQTSGSVVLVNPEHVLGFGCISSLYFSGRIYKYGFFAAQPHNECIDCLDLYDETLVKKVPLDGHEMIGEDIYMVDNTFDATYLVKMDNFRKYWFDDGNLGVYLRRLGYCNFIDKSINITKGTKNG